MITVSLRMKIDQTPLKRVPVAICLDADGYCTPPVPTDREGRARFDLPEASGKVLVDEVERYQGRLEGQVQVELWSLTEAPNDSLDLDGHMPLGSNAYPSMETRTLEVEGRRVLTDGEGYLVNPADWSEAFVRTLASAEGLILTDAHWALIRYLREYFARTGTQSTVRDMVRHFSQVWGREAGGSASLHRLFPRGGPQKQGNRLAGLLRTKGEH
jgi:tRNA 2-thiouridine synthesizing protein E